uniref:Endonuclease/exonuclease/phosphatase domain-containing protein n=1 Tax=Oryzias melastigma TaxID=30732 RepID=A0A3B3DNA2_ORYME
WWCFALVETDPEGRKLVLDIAWGDQTVRVFNIYASNDPGERKLFFRSLRPLINVNSLLIGDFNTVLSKLDLSRNNVHKSDVSRNELFSLMLDLDVIDVWRVRNPGKRQFSRRQMVQVLKPLLHKMPDLEVSEKM